MKNEEQKLINDIAIKACEKNKELDFSKCYTITLLYYLIQNRQFSKMNIPPTFLNSVMLLYKSPITSYIHYRTEIFYSNDPYAQAIKQAEIELSEGDDPRCPWLND